MSNYFSELSRVVLGDKNSKSSDLPVKDVLYLEDDHLSYLVVKKILESDGSVFNFQVDVASSVNAAIEKLNGKHYDAVLVDIYLPVKSGFDLLEHRKSSAKLIAIPYIVVTAFNNADAIARARALFADDYITKPVSHESLVETLLKLL